MSIRHAHHRTFLVRLSWVDDASTDDASSMNNAATPSVVGDLLQPVDSRESPMNDENSGGQPSLDDGLFSKESPSRLRITATDPYTGERWGFIKLQDLLVFLQEQLKASE